MLPKLCAPWSVSSRDAISVIAEGSLRSCALGFVSLWWMGVTVASHQVSFVRACIFLILMIWSHSWSYSIARTIKKNSSIFDFRSGLALHCGIDVGGDVIDANYHGPICLLLFNFGEHHFIVSVHASKSFTAFSNFCNLKQYSQVKLPGDHIGQLIWGREQGGETERRARIVHWLGHSSHHQLCQRQHQYHNVTPILI